MASNKRWLVGFMVCAILAGPLWVDKAFAAFRGTTSTTGRWASATLYLTALGLALLTYLATLSLDPRPSRQLRGPHQA
ncbi:hypothetical protein [Nonomuraea sp. NPDC049028]|uniref:hypothetical protein n=1 Tax=Nonomuraea sp. NPDC049028 TaxID=3364348 RepID=UPI003712E330